MLSVAHSNNIRSKLSRNCPLSLKVKTTLPGFHHNTKIKDFELPKLALFDTLFVILSSYCRILYQYRTVQEYIPQAQIII